MKALAHDPHSRTIGNQLLRSGTSIAANYRAAGCCRTKAEFVNKLRVVLEEADETIYWLRCIRELGTFPTKRIDPLLDEAMQLTKIFAASLKTATRK